MPQPQRTSTPYMLIVDDEIDICGMLGDFFTSHGFRTTSAFSGEEALEKVKAPVPDVILLDINLPGLSGIEVLRRIKNVYPEVPVVIITAYDETAIRERAAYYGAIDYIVKPFDMTDATWASVYESVGS